MTSQRSLTSTDSINIPLRSLDSFHHENDFGIPQTPPISDFLSSKIAREKRALIQPTKPCTTVTHTTVSIAKSAVTDAIFDNLKVAAIDEIPVVVKTTQTSSDQSTKLSSSTTDLQCGSDVIAPHDYERDGPSSASLLKMYERATETTRRRHMSEEGKTLQNGSISDLKNPKCQSLPPSPRMSPKLYRRRVGSLDTELKNIKIQDLARREGSILSRVSAMFHPPTLQEKSEVDVDFESKTENLVTNGKIAGNSLLTWGTQTKVKISDKDLNMYAPTST